MRLDKIIEIERRLPKKLVGPLAFEREQVPLNRAGAGGRDVAILRFELGGVVRHVLQHRAQIFQIEQQHPVVVRDFEDHVQHASLR